MVRRSYRGLLRAVSLGAVAAALCAPTLFVPAAAQRAPHGMVLDPAPSKAAAKAASDTPEGVMPLDLTSGKTDATPLGVHPMTNEAFDPLTPPQTVEGTLVSVAPSKDVATVRTKQYGDVKMGLPPDIYVSRNGHESSVDAMHPGDRVWATVETENGVRAVRLVSAPPANPLINWIGIPVLLLIALGIWWTGRNRGEVVAAPTAPARNASR